MHSVDHYVDGLYITGAWTNTPDAHHDKVAKPTQNNVTPGRLGQHIWPTTADNTSSAEPTKYTYK
jgi:hypothetical protein